MSYEGQQHGKLLYLMNGTERYLRVFSDVIDLSHNIV